MSKGSAESLANGLRIVGDDCRKHVISLRTMLKYAREMSFRDPRRVVESLAQALNELSELSVDLEIILSSVHMEPRNAESKSTNKGGAVHEVSPAARGLSVLNLDVLPLVVGSTAVVFESQVFESAAVESRGSVLIDEVAIEKRMRRSSSSLEGRLDYSVEQRSVIECGSDDCAVDSGAGCGKTSTLDGYARARPHERMLYIAFSRAVAEEAKGRFPKTVKCINQHSMAFGAVGYLYSSKLGKPKARQVLSYLENKKRMPVSDESDKDAIAQLALETVDEYLAGCSWNREITTEDAEDGYILPSGRYIEGRFISAAAQSLWEGMQNLEERGIPMVQDGYCKLWALSRPDLSRYRRILLDEGQDANGSLLQVLLAQQTGRVFVGDDRQRIYGFRKAVNAMDRLPHAKRLVLKTSYRFGAEIAGMANELLTTFLPGGTSLIGGGGNQAPDGSTAAVFRTNAGLFSAAAEWVDLKEGKPGAKTSGVMGELETNRGLHFVGGLAHYQFESIVDTFNLRARRKDLVKDAFIRGFASYEALQDYAEQVKDRELLARISVVDRFGDRVPYLADAMKAAHVDPSQANVSLCSAHRSKGLEWDTILFGEDYPTLMSKEGVPKAKGFATCDDEVSDIISDEEVRLMYVVMTRGRLNVQPAKSMRDFLEWKRSLDQASTSPN